MQIPGWLQKLVPGERPRSEPVVAETPEAVDIVLPARLESLGQAMDQAALYERTQERLRAQLAASARVAELAAAPPLGLAGLVLTLAKKGSDAEEESALARAGARWIQGQQASPTLAFALQVADATGDYQDDFRAVEIGLRQAQSPDPGRVAVTLCELFDSAQDRAATGRDALGWLQTVQPDRASELRLALEVADKTDTYDDEWAVLRETLGSPGPGLEARLVACCDSSESRARAQQVVLGQGATARFAAAASAATDWDDDAAAGEALLRHAGQDEMTVCRAMLDACGQDESASGVGGRLLDALAADHPERVELARGLLAASGYYETDRAILESVFSDRTPLEVCRQSLGACSAVEDRARVGQAALNALQKEYPLASLGMLAGQATTTYDDDATCAEETMRCLEQGLEPPALASSLLERLDAEQASKAAQALFPGLRSYYANPEADALVVEAENRIASSESYEDDVSALRDLVRELGSVRGIREQVEDLAAAVSGQAPGAAVAETGTHVVLGHVALKVRGQAGKR